MKFHVIALEICKPQAEIVHACETFPAIWIDSHEMPRRFRKKDFWMMGIRASIGWISDGITQFVLIMIETTTAAAASAAAADTTDSALRSVPARLPYRLSFEYGNHSHRKTADH